MKAVVQLAYDHAFDIMKYLLNSTTIWNMYIIQNLEMLRN